MPSFTSTNPEFRNNRHRQSKNKKLLSTMTDDDQAAEITILDAAGAVTAISDNETPKMVDNVWREIVAGRRKMRECKKEAPDEMMTLEDFLAKAEAVEEEVKAERLGFDLMPVSPFPFEERGKKRAVLEPLDKAAQQRQKRMIKNRESVARSRERKQAYQVELESLAVKLEEENEKLLKGKLTEKVVPVVEKRRPPRVIRRVHSMHW